MTEHVFDAAEVERLLSHAAKKPVRRFFTHDFGRTLDDRGVSAVVKDERAGRAIVDALQLVVPPGALAFIGTTHSLAPNAPKGVEIVVAPGANQFDILRLARTDACNYDMDTEAVIEKLQEFDRLCGIRIWQAETDTVQLDLVDEPRDVSAFAVEVYRFCPDIVDQGCESVDALEQIVRAHRRLFLWWD
ncbi:MAG: DUF4253 domain-containing protein [Planctomycetes bacterium]|nr:DUF4253 domain-containing protein [Planctomycetota bacterium]